MAKVTYNSKELVELKKLVDWAISKGHMKSIAELKELKTRVPEGKVLIKLLYGRDSRFSKDTDFYGIFTDVGMGRVNIQGVVGYEPSETPTSLINYVPQEFPRYGGCWGFNVYKDGELVLARGIEKYLVKCDYRSFKTGDIVYSVEPGVFTDVIKVFQPFSLVGDRKINEEVCSTTIPKNLIELLPDDYDPKSITTEAEATTKLPFDLPDFEGFAEKIREMGLAAGTSTSQHPTRVRRGEVVDITPDDDIDLWTF